jgi:Trk K+ transport system NAD-binding subunit
MIAAIKKKKGGLFIPQLSDKIEQGDFLLGVVRTESLDKVKKPLGLVKGR